MRVCDYCQNIIKEEKVIRLTFNSAWFKDISSVRNDFCSLECIRKWLEGKTNEYIRKPS